MEYKIKSKKWDLFVGKNKNFLAIEENDACVFTEKDKAESEIKRLCDKYSSMIPSDWDVICDKNEVLKPLYLSFEEIKNKLNNTKRELKHKINVINKYDIIIDVEKRNDIVYIYVFHKNYFKYDSFDDSEVLYHIEDENFYKKFAYNISSNEYSLNEYISSFKSVKECKNWLNKNNYKLLN